MNAAFAGSPVIWPGLVLSPQILHQDGTNLLPSFTFISEPSTGMYRPGTGSIGFSILGTDALEVYQINANQMNFGFGVAAPVSVGNALNVNYNYNGRTHFNYYNGSSGSNSEGDLEIATGGGSATFSMRNLAYASTAYIGGGAVLDADSSMSFLNIAAENSGAYIAFNTGGAVSATTERMRLTNNALTLNKGAGSLVMSGGTSGALTLNAPATSTYSLNFPVGQGANLTTLQNDGSGNLTWVTPTTGTVTGVSVASANGFTGTSSGGATPALTLATSVTGVLKGNGTAISAATAGTDYSAGTSALGTGILKSTTSTGALTIAVSGDFPTLNQNTTGTAANVTATSNSTLTTLSALSLPYSQLSGTVPTWNQNTTGSAASFTGTLVGDVTGTQGATVVGKINGVSLASLGTGILKNTTTTGVPSIAVAADFPTLNQNTTGTASNVTGTTNSTLTTLSSLSLPGSQVTGNISGNAANITGSLALSSIANIGAYTVLGNNTGSSAAPAAINSIVMGTPAISDTGVAFQITGNVAGYYQHILQNTNSGTGSSADFVVNNDVGTASTHYGDFGINSSTFTGTGSMNLANAVYLYSVTGDLTLGTQSANAVHIVANTGATDAITVSSTNGVALPALTTAGVLLNDTSGNITSSAGALAVGKGGTGVASVTTAPTATAFAGWDANKNLSANAHIPAFTTTATAVGTTALLVGSTQVQVFTGSTTQTVTLPVASTLVAGQQYMIVNQSTGVVTVQSSGLNTLQAMAANTQLLVTCILNSGTSTASWVWNYGTIASTALPLAAGGTGATSLATGAISSNGTVLSSGTLSVANGGTAKTAVTTAATASSWAGWDANSNLSAKQHIQGFTTTATAAGTTALLVGSTQQQYFTGSTTQTVTLPVATTLVAGQSFQIVNLSTGLVTVQSSGLNTLQAMAANTVLNATVSNTAGGTGTASWTWTYGPAASGLPLTNPMTTGGDIIYGGSSGSPTRLANGSAGQALVSAGTTLAPVWTTLSAPTVQRFTTTGTTTGYLFFVSSANATVGATYTNNGVTFTVLNTIAAGTQLFTTSAGAPLASGTLTKASGTGDATITFSGDVALATYTPTAGTKFIKVALIGGGGGSGGNAAGGATCAAAGGGGGGCTGLKWITSVAASYPYAIGLGGTAGTTTPSAGGAGGASYFGSNLMISTGGSGGGAGATQSLGADGIGGGGGTCTGSDQPVPGGPGGTGLVLTTTNGIGGQGGISMYSTGAQNFVNGSGPGAAGAGIGGGATGGMSQAANGAQAGSVGAAGGLIIEEFTQ